MGISDRVTPVTASSIMPPGCCVMCGKPAYDTAEEFLDIRTFIEGHGNVYFCKDCAREIAQEAGAPDTYKAALDHANQIIVELTHRLEKLEELERLVGGYNTTRNPGFDGNITVSYPSPLKTTISIDANEQLSLDEFAYGFADEGADTTESADEQGPDDADEPTDSDRAASIDLSL